MKKINFGIFALAVALAASSAQAGSIYLTGDVGVLPPTKTTGTINVVFDLDPGHSFQNGGVVMGINATPGAIAFEDAAVDNTGNRWTIAADVTTPNLVNFNTSSFLSPALPAGGQGVVFATINWTKTGSGRSDLGFVIDVEALVDGPLGDVTSNYQATGNFVSFVPEPTSLGLAGLSLIGLAMRRRNG